MLLRLFQNMRNMPAQDFFTMLAVMILAVVLTMIVHELCHGLAAYALGDPTARHMGRLTINPIRHIDPIGMTLLLLVGFGWARPVQVDARYFEKPKRDMALVALAGPISNFLLAFLAVGGIRLTLGLTGWFGNTVFWFLLYLATLSVGLGVFNLIPIPPLDGSKVLAAFLPARLYWTMMRYERYGMFLLIFLSMTGSLGGFLSGFVNELLGLMYGAFGLK